MYLKNLCGSFKSFFQDNELVIANNRIYYLDFYSKSPSHVSFSGSRFSLEKGPGLLNIQSNLMLQYRNNIICEINNQANSIVNSSPGQASPDDELSLCAAFVLNDILPNFNLSKEFQKRKTNNENRQIEPVYSESNSNNGCVEDIIKEEINIFNRLNQGTLASCFPGTYLILQGKIFSFSPANSRRNYRRTDSNPDSQIQINILGKKYNLNPSRKTHQDSTQIINHFHTLLSREIAEKIGSDSRINHLLDQSLTTQQNNRINAKEFYDESKNIGFKRISKNNKERFFVYCWAPEHILLERITTPLSFFRFDSVRVGLELKIGSRGVEPSNPPVVLDPYVHPAIPDLAKHALKNICFQNTYLNLINNNSTAAEITNLLQEGTKRLTSKYIAGSKEKNTAYKKLFDDEVQEALASQKLDPRNVDPKKVYNVHSKKLLKKYLTAVRENSHLISHYTDLLRGDAHQST